MKTALVTAAVLAALSSPAFAQVANPGSITFTGEIVAGACGISGDTLDQTVSLGQVIANGQNYLDSAWWISTLPGIALSLLIICGGVVGDHATRRYALGNQP